MVDEGSNDTCNAINFDLGASNVRFRSFPAGAKIPRFSTGINGPFFRALMRPAAGKQRLNRLKNKG